MKKILVPTDFSDNSKAGVQFAIHWAAQQKLQLIFIHILHMLPLTEWDVSSLAKIGEDEEKISKTTLEKFIETIYRKMKVKPGNISFVIVKGISADISILDYCRNHIDIDCICISTRGAGKFKRIFGTNTGNLVTKSKIPVMAVPGTYEVADIKTILYASDIRDYALEVKEVLAFALPFKAAINVLHFTWPNEDMFDEKMIESALKKQYKYSVKVIFNKNDAVHSLIQNLQSRVKLIKPSVVIMFTNKQRTFFEKLFLSSKAEEFSFQLKVPLLVFNKPANK